MEHYTVVALAFFFLDFPRVTRGRSWLVSDQGEWLRCDASSVSRR